MPLVNPPPLIPFAAHNAAINGAVDVSQELSTTGATLANNTAKYIADQWEGFYNHGAATAVVTSGQVAAASFGAVLPGFSFAHRLKATTAISSPANLDHARHRQKIEGYRIAKWGWGATGAKPIVVALQLYSTVSGVAFLKLSNSDQSRCLYHEITVAAGWNFHACVVVGDTSGTWQATTSIGLTVEVFTSGKEAAPASSFDAWSATNKVQTTNSTNLLGTANNETLVTGLYVDLFSGWQPIAADLPGLMRPFDEELRLCKRYFARYTSVASKALAIGHAYQTTSAFGKLIDLDVPLRNVSPTAVPSAFADFTLVVANGSGGTACTGGTLGVANGRSVYTDGLTGSAGLVVGDATMIVMTGGGYIDVLDRM